MSKICPVCERVFDDEHIFCAADGTALRGQGNADDLIGSVIDDRYVITSLLGEGGMGRVYLGQHVHLPRKVAIKVLHAKLTNDPAAVARFNREATSTSRIEHDRVARVFDFGRMPGGATYLAMEYIHGRTLAAMLEQEGALAPARAARFISQTAEGLAAAHRLGIVHRDLKPDNILIARDADGEESVKIVDFGIAKAIGPHDDGTLTAPGFVTGTPEYMSPEQLLGQTIDGRSDVFALGLVAFRTLTNTLPFAEPTPERGFGAILIDTPRRLDSVAPMRQWPSALQDVFDRVLARDPDERYPSAPAFADAFRRAIAEWEKTNADVRVTPTLRAGEPASDVSGAADLAMSTATTRDERIAVAGTRTRWLLPVAAVALIAAAGWAVTSMQSDSKAAGDSIAAGAGSPPDSVTSGGGGVSAQTQDSIVRDSVLRDSVLRVSVRQDSLRRDSVLAGSVGVRTTPATSPRSIPPADSRRGGSAAVPEVPARAAGASSRVFARMDSVRDALDALLVADDARDTPSRANALVARVDRLLPDAPSASDSARALLLKANLLKLAGNPARACSTLDEARPLAVSNADRNSVRRNSELWGC